MSSSLLFKEIKLKDFISAYFYGYRVIENEFSNFKNSLEDYLNNMEENKNQNEDFLVANCLNPFFQKLNFESAIKYKMKGKSEIDLALIKDSNIQVIIEAKKPNDKDFFSKDNPNCKALHEVILYYFRIREENNFAIKYIMLTDFLRFYIFEAKEFENIFYRNKDLESLYKSFKNQNSIFDGRTEEFYKEAKKIFDYNDFILKGAFLDLNDISDNSFKTLKPYFKILSGNFLYNEFNPNDANQLNKSFYDELLYILGLSEEIRNGKTIILPSKESINGEGTLYYNISQSLKDKQVKEDEINEAVLEILIIWINRILFLKLLESSLINFNSDKNLSFLNIEKIPNYNKLNRLFFNILAKNKEERNIESDLSYLPYLNSSLFTRSDKEIIEIAQLHSDFKLEYYKSTNIKDNKGKSKKGKEYWLKMIFDFLNSFDFGASSDNENLLSQKDLINSSVLGLVFEKLNGYKEGSYYTPSFITSYMCKESLEKIVLQKFKENGINANNLDMLQKQILLNMNADFNFRDKATKILESITILDPAVGSGHFLVSALNEMIYIYYKLGLLDFSCDMEINNDEIIIRKPNGEIFSYQRPRIENDDNHRIQKTIFNLKKSIIENNLFGVDINPNSCEITKLRLWIELLKNSYYLSFNKNEKTDYHDLETLPNIDINIKCGNSLISRFDLKDALKNGANINKQIEEYKKLVFLYKNSDKSKIAKRQIESKINDIKKSFTLTLKDAKTKSSLEKAIERHIYKYGKFLLDDESLLDGLHFTQSFLNSELDEKEKEEAYKSYGEIRILRKKLDSTLNGEEYKNAFEYRFEFPEVLDNDGNFLGFDLIIGNPPYISTLDLSKSNIQSKDIYKKHYKNIKGLYDIYILFILIGLKLKSYNGCFAWIIPNKFLVAKYAKETLDTLINNNLLGTCIDVSNVNTFEKASIYPFVILGNNNAKFQKFYIENKDDLLDGKLKTTKRHINLERFKTFANFGLKIQSGLAGFQAHSIIEFIVKKKKKGSIPFAVSGSIDRYSINTNEVKYMKRVYKNPQIIPNNAVSKDKWNFWRNEKIVIAGMTKKLEACYIPTPLAIGVGVYAIYDFQGLNPFLILGVLNSKFMNYVFISKFQDKHLAGGYLGINKNNLETLPVFELNSKNKKSADKIIRLVDRILKRKTTDPKSDTSKLEKEIDNLVYELYGLSKSEIRIIEKKDK